MTKQTHLEVYVHAQETFDGYMFQAFACDMSDCGYIPVAKIEVPVPELSDEQIKARHLVLLKLEREQVYAKARKEAERLDERIAKLESLSYTPTTQEDPL